MATVIRFSRQGSKKRPIFKIVVQEKTSPRDGKFIELIGSFNPVIGEQSFKVVDDRLSYWVSKGALVSESVNAQIKKLRKRGPSAGAEATQKADSAAAPAKKATATKSTKKPKAAAESKPASETPQN